MIDRTEMDRWPVDESGTPLPPRAQPGYYPGYSTLAQQRFWDEATREVVLERVNQVPPIRFFTPDEARLMEAVCARVLPQDDRDEAHRIPIVPFIDKRLHEDQGYGYRYADMPQDPEAYRLGLKGIEAIAMARHRRSFIELDMRQQEEILRLLHRGQADDAGHEIWKKMSIHRFWMLLVQDVCAVYYAHPWAWDEIGYGGPAYPRGYMRLEHGLPEPWEVEEQRYAWYPPPASLSGEVEMSGGHEHHYGSPGQGGTH